VAPERAMMVGETHGEKGGERFEDVVKLPFPNNTTEEEEDEDEERTAKPPPIAEFVG
jgi:hypothetical protein